MLIIRSRILHDPFSSFRSKSNIEKIIKGEKTIELRFSRTRHMPYQKIKRGDIVLLKPVHGHIIGQVEVENVLFYDNLTPEAIGKMRQEYGKDAEVGDDYWQKKSKSKYATLLFMRHPERYIIPLKSAKKDRRHWVEIKSA